ncbi:hypothetical protein FOZ63_001724, partial [Perkinsus olseni]
DHHIQSSTSEGFKQGPLSPLGTVLALKQSSSGLPPDLTCILHNYLGIVSTVSRYATKGVGLDATWRMLFMRDHGHHYRQYSLDGTSPMVISVRPIIPPYDLYRLLYFRQHRAGGLHVGPGRTLLQMTLKGCGVVEVGAALDYLQDLSQNATACSAALYLCANADSKGGKTIVSLSCAVNDFGFEGYVGAWRSLSVERCHMDKSEADFQDIHFSFQQPRQRLGDSTSAVEDIAEELELAVKYRDKLCAKG